jgi:Zn-dependent protease
MQRWRFSGIEIKELIISWIALSIIFSFPQIIQGSLLGLFLILPTLGVGFVLHELGHKIVAQNYGFFAEYRMDPSNLMLAFFLILATTLMGNPFVFAAPGAVMIYPVSSFGRTAGREENGRISIAGPLVNLGLCGFFLLLMLLSSSEFVLQLAAIGLQVNALLAVFNLIPFGPLDGAKIYGWSKGIWGSAVLLALFAMTLG